jgi:hypothetical protein
MGFIDTIRAFHKGKITKKQAEVICREFPIDSVLSETGMGKTVSDSDHYTIDALNKEFEPFKFRIILCHNREFTYWALTYKDPDPREYGEMSKKGYWDSMGDYHLNKKKKK